MRSLLPVTRITTGLALAGLLVGCQGGSRTPATLQPEAAASPQDFALAQGSLLQQEVGSWQVTIDPATLTAGAEALFATRLHQQSELYTLSIAAFMRPDTLKITGVTADPQTLYLHYRTTHPFPAPTNLAGPPSAGNRADLAVTGRVLWLLDDPDAAVYFPATDQVRVNTRLITNPDGYLKPGALIADPGTTSNTFPFQLLTNEAADNRIGLSNGGQMTGNYGPGGWQTAQFATGPTGYGIWSQGQATTHTLALDKATLATMGAVSVRASILVKYEDPRGGNSGVERRSNRLPQDDVSKFAYRMPHGALDVEAVAFLGHGAGLVEGQASFVTLDARVVDWDARAQEAGTVHLGEDSDTTLVSAGSSGVPVVTLHVPGIAGSEGNTLVVLDDDTAYGGDVDPDTGHPQDALFYQGTLSGTPATAGALTGMLRAIDPTDVTPPADWSTVRRNLAPDLSALGTALEGTVYQHFNVTVDSAAVPPVASWSFVSGQSVTCEPTVIELTVPTLGPTNTTGNYLVGVDWGDGTPVVPEPENIAGGPQTYSHTYAYTGTPPTPQVRTISITLTDADPPGESGPATPPADPNVTVNSASAFSGWAKRFGGANLDFGFDVEVGPDGSVLLAGGAFSSIDFGGGLRTNGGNSDPYVAKFASDGTYLWDRHIDTTGNDFFRAVTVDSAGNVYAHGEYEGTVNFGGGPLTSAGAQDAVLVKWNSAGVFQWAQRFGGGGSETSTGARCDSQDRVIISGYSYSAAFSFGGPPTVFSPHYLTRFTPTGTFDGQYTINCGGASTGGFGMSPSDGFVLVGQFSVYAPSSVNFGGGGRSTIGGTATDAYAVALDSNFNYLWDYVGGGNTWDSAQGACVLSDGTTIFVGNFAGTATFGSSTFTAAGAQDLFVVRLSNIGAPLAAFQYGGAGSDNMYDVKADAQDNYAIACSLAGTTNFGGGSVTGGAAIVKYSSTGTWLWNNVYGASGSARGLGFDPCGRVFIGGDFQGTADFNPGAGVFNLTSAGSLDPFITGVNADGTW
ncbi:MAG: hypothetical protein GEEBNDBF_02052 [bacterium]|nr:hypothetical protein [bacterium]